MEHAQFTAALRRFAPYAHRHHGATFVVALPGEVVASAEAAASLFDIALLRSLGVRVVLVHGARPQIDARLAADKLDCPVVDGLRVTTLEALSAVKAAIGSVRMDIEALLSTGLASGPMSGARIEVASGNWVTARPLGVRSGTDYQHTGEVRRINTKALNAALDRGAIVLLSPSGYSPTGETFNLLGEEVAQSAATALGADKLVYLTHGVEPEPASQITLVQARERLADSTELHRQAALRASESGVARVHLVAADVDGGLLAELYTRDGFGLMIAGDTYDETRPATIDDVGGILKLIEPLEQAGALVPRSREQLELEIDQYLVMARDDTIIACCALVPFKAAEAGEVACVAVHPDYRGQSRAEVLLEQVELRAAQSGLRTLFALTTHTPHWFIERGFAVAQADELPIERQRAYNAQRGSKVLIKALP
ncbi:amino-acid N-acetyltransferase [bacterium]|nr:amino-acid N-acetyltransferase [bacterium]